MDLPPAARMIRDAGVDLGSTAVVPGHRGRRPRICGVDGDLSISRDDFLALGSAEAAVLILARYEALQARGCDEEGATIVACHPEISVNAALALIERGCAPRTAVRILL